MSRILSWFSCGVTSAVAAKLAVEKYGDRVTVVYCDTMVNEHPSNENFMKDVEQWIGKQITRIFNPKYETKRIEQTFSMRKYMAGRNGAACTVQLKKVPRFLFQNPDDIHIFGFSYDEQRRINRFKETNPELLTEFILDDNRMTKNDCVNEIMNAGIPIPEMYLLGYPNNNCIGCVKASSPTYWNKIRVDFPWVFENRARQSRQIGCRLVKYKGERMFLDELPVNAKGRKMESISCGPDCGHAGK